MEEAIDLLVRISNGLEETADDLHQIVSEIHHNSKDELEYTRGLAENRLKINTEQQAAKLRESINITESNTAKVLQESKDAKEEAIEAQKELEYLTNMDKYVSKLRNKSHETSEPMEKLSNAEDRLRDAEWKLGEIPEEINQVKQSNEKTVQILGDSTRREYVKTAGSIGLAAITGLAGCTTTKNSEKNDLIKVRYGQIKTLSINDNEYSIEAVSFSNERGVVIKIDGEGVRVREGDSLQANQLYLGIKNISYQNREIALELIPEQSDIDKKITASEGNLINFEDREFVVRKGRSQTFNFLGEEHTIQVIDIDKYDAAIRVDGSIREVSEGDEIALVYGSDESLYANNFYNFDDEQGFIEFKFVEG